MFEVQSLAGQQFKLASDKGTLLGTVIIPRYWADYIRERGAVQFSTILYPIHWHIEKSDMEMIATQGCLYRSHDIRDAICLYGVSLEEFEQLDGCSFSPSAAYIRSVLD